MSKKCQYSCDVAYPKFSTLVKVDCISQSLSRGVIIGKTIKKAILLKFSDIYIKPISIRGRQTIHPHIGFVSPQKILRLHPCVSIMLLYSSESKKRKKKCQIVTEAVSRRKWKNFCFTIKFIYSEKATKLCEIFTLLLTGTTQGRNHGENFDIEQK